MITASVGTVTISAITIQLGIYCCNNIDQLIKLTMIIYLIILKRPVYVLILHIDNTL